MKNIIPMTISGTPKKTLATNVLPIPTKHELALYDLLESGRTGISKLTTLSSYGETSLPTTISELGSLGFDIARERRPHTHKRGGRTFFTWYWLADRGEAYKALIQVNKLRCKRKVEPITNLITEQFIHGFSPTEELTTPYCCELVNLNTLCLQGVD